MINKSNILDVNVSTISSNQLIELIINTKSPLKPLVINNVNAHAYFLTFKDDDFRKILNRSDIVFCDGIGVKLAAKILKKQIGQRMTPPDWIGNLFIQCTLYKRSIFFLGDTDEVIKLYQKFLQTKFPELIIAGFHHGFFKKTGSENEAIINMINISKADILITGMGMPLQEKWADQNMHLLKVNSIIAVGALFRWQTGVEQRGPKWVTDNGFEWFWRLLIQPKKVWYRYLYELPIFIGCVLKRKIFNK